MNDPVVVKLISGETVIGIILNESLNSLVVQDPLIIKTIHIPSPEGLIEKTVTNPFCNISNEREYVFDMKHVMFIKTLHPRIIRFYEQFLKMMYQEGNDYVEHEDHTEEQESILIIPEKTSIH